MRGWHAMAVGLASAACLVTACGKAGPAAQAPAAGPEPRQAERFRLLEVNPVCTPSPGGCTAVSALGTFGQGTESICFNVVDNGSTDQGTMIVTINGIGYTAVVTNVVVANNGVTISALVQDVNMVNHAVSVVWGFGFGADRQVTVDNVSSDATAISETVLAGQCEPGVAACLF